MDEIHLKGATKDKTMLNILKKNRRQPVALVALELAKPLMPRKSANSVREGGYKLAIYVLYVERGWNGNSGGRSPGVDLMKTS